jgi:hypothetical protein
MQVSDDNTKVDDITAVSRKAPPFTRETVPVLPLAKPFIFSLVLMTSVSCFEVQNNDSVRSIMTRNRHR